ncbi:MAG: hypothetical protein V1837_03345 [Candidatus Woesearchaeota archaeon]
MDSEEYQLTSRKELVDLKEQLKKLRDGSISPDKNLPIMMANLQKTMLEMIVLFKEAAHEMKAEEGEQNLYKKLEELGTKIDILLDQNEKIGEGILSVADLIKGEEPKPASQPFRQPEPLSPPPMMQRQPDPFGPPQFGQRPEPQFGQRTEPQFAAPRFNAPSEPPLNPTFNPGMGPNPSPPPQKPRKEFPRF